MTTRLPWWKKHVSDWRAGTRGMSLELKGFYGECLDAQWDLQHQLPLDEKKLAIMLDCNPRSIRKLMPKLIALGKIIRTATGYYNPRMTREILKVETIPSGDEFDPVSENFDANSDRIQTEFDAKVPKNPYNSTRVFKIPETRYEKKIQTDGASAREDRPADDFVECKAAFNGSTAAMLAEVAKAMNLQPNEPQAAQWLANLLRFNGQDAVAQSFQMLLTAKAEKRPIARILPWWSTTAATLKSKRKKHGSQAKVIPIHREPTEAEWELMREESRRPIREAEARRRAAACAQSPTFATPTDWKSEATETDASTRFARNALTNDLPPENVANACRF